MASVLQITPPDAIRRIQRVQTATIVWMRVEAAVSLQAALKNGEIRCGDYNANELIERAAEVFAAEFIYPEQEFLKCAESHRLVPGKVTPETVVEFKRVCGAPVSYRFLTKRLASDTARQRRQARSHRAEGRRARLPTLSRRLPTHAGLPRRFAQVLVGTFPNRGHERSVRRLRA